MHRRLTLLAGAAFLAARPVLAQTEQQRAQAAQGQTAGQTGGAPSATAPSPASTTSRAEVVTAQEFTRLAAMSDRFEIASSRLAQQKAQGAEVKQFAERMVQDHTRTTQELQQLMQQLPGAAQGGQPTGAQGGPQHEGLDQQHAALLQQLQQASGAEFDRLYVRQQVMAHQQAVDMFQNFSRSGDNPQLKQWAAKTLPDLQQHLQMAQALQRTVQG